MNTKFLQELKANIQPDIQIYKIGPEVIEGFIGKVIVLMGGTPKDIHSVVVENDKKKLKISAIIEKDSKIFREEEPEKPLALLGSNADDDMQLSSMAVSILRDLGFSYQSSEDDKTILMYKVTEYKKNVEIEFSADIIMAIITDTNYCDEYFTVDATEEVVRKKAHNKKKFKGKKRTVTFAKVQATYHEEGGYSPDQVARWKNGYIDNDTDDDEDED